VGARRDLSGIESSLTDVEADALEQEIRRQHVIDGGLWQEMARSGVEELHDSPVVEEDDRAASSSAFGCGKSAEDPRGTALPSRQSISGWRLRGGNTLSSRGGVEDACGPAKGAC